MVIVTAFHFYQGGGRCSMMWAWLIVLIYYSVCGHLGLLLLFAVMNIAGMGTYRFLLGHGFHFSWM